jgi:hypothetical protein
MRPNEVLLILARHLNRKEGSITKVGAYMKKTIAYTISTVLLVNSFQLAFASNETQLAKDVATGVQSALTSKEIAAITTKSQKKTIEELNTALDQVRTLMSQIEQIQNVNESDPYLRYATQAQLAIIASSTWTMKLHLSRKDSNNIILGFSTAQIALDTFIAHYKENNKIDEKVLSKIIFDASRKLAKSGKLPAELAVITNNINSIGAELTKNQGQIAELITNPNTIAVKDVTLLVSFVYFVLHLAYPKIAKEGEGFFRSILPKVEAGALQASEGAKKVVGAGNTYASGLSDVLGMVLGMNSAESQKLVQNTLFKLNEASINFDQEISRLNTQVK